MALCEIRWLSNMLQKQVATFVILPDAGPPPFPVYYLLHGLSDDYATWRRKTRIEVYAADYPFIIVMPDGFRGFYTDNNAGPAYGRYIAEELPAMIQRNFPARHDRSGRCIGGLSMGGYGALRIALRHPDKFISANSHSGGLMVGSRPASTARFPNAVQIFGDNPQGTDHDLIHLAKNVRSAPLQPHLRIDCGQDDKLLPESQEFHKALQDLQIPHEYEEFPGNHNWDYWDAHVRRALAFHASFIKT